MRLHPDDEQLMLRDSIARFARDGGDLTSGLADLGLLALVVPEAAGGLGGRGSDLMVMMEAVGHGLLAAPLMGAIAALDLLARHGTAAQQAQWVVPAMDGARRLCLAQTDGAGLPLVPGADTADALVLVTGGRAHVLALDGLSRDALPLADGTGAARLRLDNARADPLPATPDQIADSIARASVAASAQMLGIMERMLADTLDYVKTRQQFGTVIGSFQTIQHRMARLFVGVNLCRSMVLAAAVAEGGDRPDWLRKVAAAQALVGEQALHLAHECVQFHGGMGITQELAVARGHKQLMVLARLFGSPAQARQAFDRLAG
ncbi:acyl-CoA dehydrogenase family protein [Gemmobacter sp.]|uniref:acyl-CoA dehydrogenase family protein n=1 Tax=Gemmobacter sp. TaxID=1898957 RepID=UPI002AFE30D1|nr:acyl-CoA dehydrogenase family protein [Gemmobacter sp.]